MEVIVFFLVFLVFLLACYEDIKKKEIYDYLNFTFIVFILTIATLDSLINNTIDPLKYAGFGLLLGFSLGSLLYYLGVWGGGDAKFLIGFSAASFYILPFVQSHIPPAVSNYLLTNFSTIFQSITTFAQDYIVLINLGALFYILYFITKKQEEQIIKNALYLLTLIGIFTFGLMSTQSPIYLLIIGMIAFLLIFFANEYLFYSVFITYKKNTHKLKQKDILNEDISQTITQEKTKYGMSKKILDQIQNLKNKPVEVRKPLPFSLIVTINFIFYIFAILSIDETNLEMLFFLIKFLFISFMVGGAIAIIMMVFYFVKNFNTTKTLYSQTEKIAFFIIMLFFIIGFFTDFLITYLALLGLVYFFVKSAKLLEKLMFVKKRSLKDIVLGDWIMQDIKVGNKIYFTKEDFKLGVNEHQLKKIKELAKNNPQLEQLYIKDGIAFLPPLFIGFIIALLI